MAEEMVFNSSDGDEEKVFDTYSNGGNEIVFDSGNFGDDEEMVFSSDDGDDGSEEVGSFTAFEDTEEDQIIFGSGEDGSVEDVVHTASAETEEMLFKPNSSYNPDEVTKDFFMSANAQTSIGMFMKSRYGKSGIRKDDETKDEYTERFFEQMRWMQNNIASTGSGLAWLHGADEKTKQNFGVLYTQFNDMPAFWEDGGGGAYNGVVDTVMSVVLDPTNVATFGVGMGFKILGGRIAAQTVLKKAITSNAGRIAGAASVEGILGAMQAGNIQSLEIEANLRKEKDWDIILGMGVLAATVTGGINVGMLNRGLKDKTYKEKLLRKMDDNRNKAGLDGGHVPPSERVYDSANGPLSAQIEDVATVFDAALDINLNNASNPRTRITVVELQDAKMVVAELMSAIPSLAPRENETITKAFHRAFFSLDMADGALLKEIDDELINKGLTEGNKGHNFTQAMARLKNELDDMGITPAQFGAITDVDISTAAKLLNMQSQLSKVMKKLDGGLTVTTQNAMAKAKQEDIINASWASRILNSMGTGVMKSDRVRRAIMTSQPATTARNIVSGTAAVTMHTASRLLRNTFAGIGHAAKAVNPLDPSVNLSFRGTVGGLDHVVRDALSMIGDIFNHGENRELVDLVLGDNAILHHQLLRTTQEAGTNELPRWVMLLNGLNIAQDQFLRTGVFMNSIKRQMKELGDVPDVTMHLSTGGKIPVDVAQAAVDEALAITFANVPKNGAAKAFVTVVEKLPFFPIVGTGAFPFARFMANAMTFQFRYFPTNSFGAIATKLASRKLIKQGQPGGERLAGEAARQFNDGLVGFAAIAAAIAYRSDKQETTTYDEILNEDGSTIGIGAVFPLPFYFMVADLLIKHDRGTLNTVKAGDVMQAITGFQASAGGLNYFFDNFMTVMADNGIESGKDVSSEKFSDAIGKYTGELAGQYFTPAKLVRDVMAAFDEEQNLRRDANVVTSKGSGDRFVESFLNKAVVNLPHELQLLYKDKPLPAQQDAVRGEDQYNVAPVLTQMTGMKIIPARSDVANELLTMGIKPYLMLSPTGDKQADALIRKHMPEFVDAIMAPIINSKYYKDKTLTAKRNVLNEAKAMVIKYAKQRAEADFAEVREVQGYSPKARARWVRIPKNKRREVNERWMSMYGTTIDSSNQYEAGAAMAKSLGGL